MAELPRAIEDAGESRLRLQTSVRLRWFAVLGQLIAIGVVYLGFRFPLPVGYCLLLIATSAWLNVFLRVTYPVRHRLTVTFATLLLAYDILQLAALLYLTGGILNPFLFLVVAPVTVSAATLPPRNTLLLGVIAAVVAGLLVRTPWPLPWFPTDRLELPMIYKLGILASVYACTTFLALYAFRLSKEAGQMAAALSATELVLAREQQLHALDGLAAAAAHELGTPLATIVLVTKEMARDLPEDHALSEDIALLQSQAMRCRDILQKLTRQPSEQDPLHAGISVTQMIDESAAPYRTGAKTITIDASSDDGVDPAAAAEPVALRRPGVIYGLGNLIENAVEFARSAVEITARWNSTEVMITVADDGPGFAPEIMETLGEPYVTTRAMNRSRLKQASGLGLGFFIAKTLLERSGATVVFGNRQGRAGALVAVTWPRRAFESADETGVEPSGFRIWHATQALPRRP